MNKNVKAAIAMNKKGENMHFIVIVQLMVLGHKSLFVKSKEERRGEEDECSLFCVKTNIGCTIIERV